MLPSKLVPLALLALSQAVAAQSTPGAAGQFQQIPPAPVIPKAAPALRIEHNSAAATPGADEIKFKVTSLRVSGARAYAERDLVALSGFRANVDVSMADLVRMAARIADRYHRDGYLLAQAYLPAQDINNGAVTIAVLEGTYGKVTIRNRSALSDRVVQRQLEGLRSGDTVTRAPLDHRLLLLSDNPGVDVRSTLVPGASVGSSDLIVDLAPGRRLSGSVEADNAGSRYTGQYRAGATLNWNEPLGIGDVASLRTLTSGKGLNYARASYQLPIGKVKAGLAYSKLRYELIEEFAPLHAHGTAEIASVFANYPLLRTRNTNLNVQLAYDDKSFRDQIDATGALGEKGAKVLMASLYGDHGDAFGGGGANTFALTVSSGTLDLQTPSLRALDAQSARSNGGYAKLAFSASRVQRVTDALSLAAAINGQVASKNLDVSEKMELGGMHAVRAFPEGEAYADQGYVLSVEARLLLAPFTPNQRSQVQALAFVDSGTVERDHQPWSDAPNRRTLSGAGIGLVWSENANFLLRAYYARKLGSQMATSSPDKPGRFWVQAVKYF
ncbi:ShlB/FhaC/HecB family hemolysin secretion/activation protein [Massilia sp. TWP1-3-3]|uniref:ShlB/FhaC/HecB family hemolysin secretion/activation protein n=1 Tax=Massilia sp. TWP1-3-3 TaxID=2804573 RepID=UPI003CE75044